MSSFNYYENDPVPQSQLADFGSRLGAFLIDVTLLTVLILGIFAVLLGLIIVDRENGNEPSTSVIVGGMILYFFGPFLITSIYFSVMESSKYQGSIGKILVGLQVVDYEGKKISFFHALGRNLSRFLSGILMIGYLIALATDRRQTLHDIIASTLVVSKKEREFDDSFNARLSGSGR